MNNTSAAYDAAWAQHQAEKAAIDDMANAAYSAYSAALAAFNASEAQRQIDEETAFDAAEALRYDEEETAFNAAEAQREAEELAIFNAAEAQREAAEYAAFLESSAYLQYLYEYAQYVIDYEAYLNSGGALTEPTAPGEPTFVFDPNIFVFTPDYFMFSPGYFIFTPGMPPAQPPEWFYPSFNSAAHDGGNAAENVTGVSSGLLAAVNSSTQPHGVTSFTFYPQIP